MLPSSPLDERGELPPNLGMAPHVSREHLGEDVELRTQLRDTLSREFRSLGDRIVNDVGARVLHTVKQEFRKYMLDFAMPQDDVFGTNFRHTKVVGDETDDSSQNANAGMASEFDLMAFTSARPVKSGDKVDKKLRKMVTTNEYIAEEAEEEEIDTTWADQNLTLRNSAFSAISSKDSATAIWSGDDLPGSVNNQDAHTQAWPQGAGNAVNQANGILVKSGNGKCNAESRSRSHSPCHSPRTSIRKSVKSDHSRGVMEKQRSIRESLRNTTASTAVNFLKRQATRDGEKRKWEDAVKTPARATEARRTVRDTVNLDLSDLKNIQQLSCGMFMSLFIRSEVFDYIMGFFLMANAVVIGWQVDYMSDQDTGEVPFKFLIWDWIFCGLFTFELLARLFLYRRRFFHMRGWQWNLFDTLVVTFQILDELAQLLLKGTSTQAWLDNLNILRLLRLARIARLIRMVRLIPELKSMVCLVSASMWSFFWTVVLLCLMMFCFAVYYTEMASDARVNQKMSGDALDRLVSHWGSVGTSVLSLYMSITGGDDWRNFTDVFGIGDQSSPIMNTLLFSLYISFSTLVMLNLVTGVFVEGAQRIIKEDKDNELIKQVCRLFLLADSDQSHDISWEEFALHLEDKRMDEYFRAVDLGRGEAKNLFKLLDVDHSGSISVEEFVRGCLRLRGPARSVDLAALTYDFTQKDMNMNKKLSQLEQKMAGIGRLLKKQLWNQEAVGYVCSPAAMRHFEEVLV